MHCLETMERKNEKAVAKEYIEGDGGTKARISDADRDDLWRQRAGLRSREEYQRNQTAVVSLRTAYGMIWPPLTDDQLAAQASMDRSREFLEVQLWKSRADYHSKYPLPA